MKSKLARRALTVLAATLIATVALCGLAGCDSELKTPSDVQKMVRDSFPQAKLVDVVQGNDADDPELEYVRYTFDNKGVRFTVSNLQQYVTIDATKTGFKDTSLSIDYMYRLMEKISPDAKNLSARLKTTYDLEFALHSHGDLNWGVTFTLQNASALGNVNKALDEIGKLMGDYLPTGKGSLARPPQLTVYLTAPDQSSSDKGFYSVTMAGGSSDKLVLDSAMISEADYLMKTAAAAGKLSLPGLSEQDLASLPLERSNGNIYLNGNRFTSERYTDIPIVYNPEDQKYYLPVIFALDVEYNGGVQDFAQREIIEMLYSNPNYTIVSGEKTTYSLGNDQFTVSREKDSNGYANYTFYCNGKNLQIKGYHELLHGKFTPSATYMVMISADDYATLIGCTVERIDYATASVYFAAK